MIAENSQFHDGSEQDGVFLDLRLGADHLVDVSGALLQDAVIHQSLFTLEFDINLFIERFWQVEIFLIPTQANHVEQCSEIHSSVRCIFAEGCKDVPLEDSGTRERIKMKKLQKRLQIVQPVLNRCASKAPLSLCPEAFGSTELVRSLIPNPVSCSTWLA